MATQFLTTWSLNYEHPGPMSREDAELLAEQWEQDAEDNGIARTDLRAAAGGSVADYLLRTYGHQGDEIET